MSHDMLFDVCACGHVGRKSKHGTVRAHKCALGTPTLTEMRAIAQPIDALGVAIAAAETVTSSAAPSTRLWRCDARV